MGYDYYPYYYTSPRYYSSYSPSYYLGDRYYRYYRPSYPSTYTTTRSYLTYRPSYDYKYISPDYSYRYNRLYTTTPISRMLSPVYPEAVRYDYTYGMDFDSATKDIRSSASKLLDDVRQTTPRSRFIRASSLEPLYSSDFDYYAARRAVNRIRMMSEEPTTIRSIKYY